jgi:hypothetical protein
VVEIGGRDVINHAGAAVLRLLADRGPPHARVEDTIRCGKQTGLGHLPSTSIEINRAWCLAALVKLRSGSGVRLGRGALLC